MVENKDDDNKQQQEEQAVVASESAGSETASKVASSPAAAAAVDEKPNADTAEVDKEKNTSKTVEEQKGNEQTNDTTAATETKKDEPDSAVLEAVADRLRFFFSDSNIRQDHYLRRPLMNNRGKYPYQVLVANLLRFNTIKQHTSDAHVLVQAAKRLLPELLVVSDDGKAIGRKDRFTTEQLNQNIPVTLHVMGLPVVTDDKNIKDGQLKYDVSTEELRHLFVEYGKIAIIKLRFKKDAKDPQGGSSGSRPRMIPAGAAFVEFETQESYDKAAADLLGEGDAKPKRTLTLGDSSSTTTAVLQVESMQAFVDRKKKEDAENEEAAAAKNEKDDGDKTGAPTTEKTKSPSSYTIDWKPGCVLRLEGLSTTKCDREAIIASIAKGLDLTEEQVMTEKRIYVDYSRTNEKGAIRFNEAGDEDMTKLCSQYASGTLEIAGDKVGRAIVLEGEEETKYWEDYIAFKNKQKKQQQHRHGGNRRDDRGKSRGSTPRNKRARHN